MLSRYFFGNEFLAEVAREDGPMPPAQLLHILGLLWPPIAAWPGIDDRVHAPYRACAVPEHILFNLGLQSGFPSPIATLLGKKSVSKTTQQKLDVRLSSLHKSLTPCERRAWCRKLQYVTSPNSLPYATGDRKRPALEGNVLGLSSL